MEKYTKKELDEALKVVNSTIANCEKMQVKFKEGTSQHSLLKNRLKALYISRSLMLNDNIEGKYTKEELIEAKTPILSIISKCEKGISKFEEGHSSYTRFRKIIDSMNIAKVLISDEIGRLS